MRFTRRANAAFCRFCGKSKKIHQLEKELPEWKKNFQEWKRNLQMEDKLDKNDQNKNDLSIEETIKPNMRGSTEESETLIYLPDTSKTDIPYTKPKKIQKGIELEDDMDNVSRHWYHWFQRFL